MYTFGFVIEEILEGISSSGSADAAGVLAIVAILVIGFILICFAFGLLSYILSSISMMRIAERRGIQNPWLAWVPIGSSWILGSISDQYQYVTYQKVRNFRTYLVIGGIASIALSVIINMFTSISNAYADTDMLLSTTMLPSFFRLLLSSSVSLALRILVIIAQYDIYRSAKPNQATTYLLLSIFFPVAVPFFLYSCRNSDEGMPFRPSAPKNNVN